MSTFLFCWTIYVIYSLRGEEIVKIKTDNVKEILKFTKEMALDNKKKPEFNAEIMQVAQRRMFILLQVATLIVMIIGSVEGFIVDAFVNKKDDPHHHIMGKCDTVGDK